jgi:hypothetical protein
MGGVVVTTEGMLLLMFTLILNVQVIHFKNGVKTKPIYIL